MKNNLYNYCFLYKINTRIVCEGGHLSVKTCQEIRKVSLTERFLVRDMIKSSEYSNMMRKFNILH